MEFESPDVERDFPGLYASESGKRSNESDFSDEAHEKISKKDLLIGKRKDKKDSKKDRGYATLEGESSPEEDTDIKSPSKLKKSKPFKFPSKKEKREKSREKDVKDKESDKDKKKSEEKEKEKKKETKVKLKLKERKKSKHGDDFSDVDDLPIFGVPLSVATERSKCHDGVDIPLIVRDCIDHVQQTGLTAENLYKISGIKSRVQHVRRLYNQRESVKMSDYDLPVATSLLKTFLRELPEPILTTDLLVKFEEAGALRDVASRGLQFKNLVDKLPSCNRTLLAWLLKHFDSIADHEKQNKMNAQSIATAMSPVLQTSERLLTALLCHSTAIFPNTRLTRYVPPLSCGALPDSINEISIELKKQESLLGQIHKEMQEGRVSKQREEQLWEVQRIITQLKRKLRALERGAGQRSLDETDNSLRSADDDLDLSLQKPPTTPNSYHHPPTIVCATQPSVMQLPLVNNIPIQQPAVVNAVQAPTNSVAQGNSSGQVIAATSSNTLQPPPVSSKLQQSLSVVHPAVIRQNSSALPPMINDIKHMTSESMEVEEIYKEAEKKQKAVVETEELIEAAKRLRVKIHDEKQEIETLRSRITQLRGTSQYRLHFYEETDEVCGLDDKGLREKDIELREETKRLHKQNQILVKSICAEYDNCIDLRVQIKLLRKNH